MFDGDMGSMFFIMSNSGNQATKEYLNSPRFVVDPSGELTLSLSSDLSRVVMYTLTRPRKK